jgi:CDP-diacylglycerol--glycerol-3-phosphate 3-phosphatidyltransferase
MMPRGKPSSDTVVSSRRVSPLPVDSDIIQSLIDALPHVGSASASTGNTGFHGAWLGLSSAYLNPTEKLLQCFEHFTDFKHDGRITLLTAGKVSHGFSPKHQSTPPAVTPRTKDSSVDSNATLAAEKPSSSVASPALSLGSGGHGRGWIPEAYALLNMSVVARLGHAVGLRLYDRPGWTFHAKGMWLCGRHVGDCQVRCPRRFMEGGGDGDTLGAVVVGSGNYGHRSEERDVESNCVVVLNNYEDAEDGGEEIEKVRDEWVQEWNELCKYAKPTTNPKIDVDGSALRDIALGVIKRFL